MKYQRSVFRFHGIHRAVLEQNYKVVKRLISKKRHLVDYKDTLDSVTPLFLASEMDDITMIDVLIELGATVNMGNGTAGKYGLSAGIRALDRAAYLGNENAVKRLLQVKCINVNPRHINLISPLAMACRKGHYTISKLLLESGAHIESIQVSKRPLLQLLEGIENNFITIDRHIIPLHIIPLLNFTISNYNMALEIRDRYQCLLMLLAHGVHVRPEDYLLAHRIYSEFRIALVFDFYQIRCYRKWRRILTRFASKRSYLLYLVFEKATQHLLPPALQRRFWNMEKSGRDAQLFIDCLVEGRKKTQIFHTPDNGNYEIIRNYKH